MLVVFYGTSAELIKYIGLLKRVERSEILIICTAQQKSQVEPFHKQLGVYPDIYLAQGWRGHDVHNIFEMLGFMLKLHINFILKYHNLRSTFKEHNRLYNCRSIGLVHGDTLTTLVGSYFSILLGLKVAHIEAGLRSGRLFQPFPEEIDRRIVSKIARIHFSPNLDAVKNLKRESTRGVIINTKFNTSKDSMDEAIKFKSKIVKRLNLPSNYVLVSIHRTELLERKNDLEEFIKLINELSIEGKNIVFVDHSTTREKLKALGLDRLLLGDNIIRIPKLAYMDFIQVVRKSTCIITDSGGLQEDAYFLGIPTIIHRSTTERSEGLGLNIELSGLDLDKIREFVTKHKCKSKTDYMLNGTSPSQIVVDYLAKNRYIKQYNSSLNKKSRQL